MTYDGGDIGSAEVTNISTDKSYGTGLSSPIVGVLILNYSHYSVSLKFR
jgi:hypothetical protein